MNPINSLLTLERNIECIIPEADTICPACTTNYAVDERRQHAVKCPVCCGTYGRAKSASEEIEHLARQDLPVETLEKLVSVMGSGMWRAEFRAALKKKLANNPEGVE